MKTRENVDTNTQKTSRKYFKIKTQADYTELEYISK